MPFVKKVHNEKQKKLIDIFKNNTDEAFDYFKTYANELINLID
jgi:predicted choloylglycine hydrolase